MYKTILIFIAIMLAGGGGIVYMFDQQHAVTDPRDIEYELRAFGTECYNENGTAHLRVFLENTGDIAISMAQTRLTITTVTDEIVMNRTYNLSAAGRNDEPAVEEPANISDLDPAPTEPRELSGYNIEIADTGFDPEVRYEIDIRVRRLDQTIKETCQVSG